ncbi:MarR family winged helix-turn-helix transcriptional regulator [Anaeromicrobium sediminis]|uniref:HTH marR-type domain-containing protein n=1 Tax=Anaeromicrobium sediminis TaxID=1478221 RepID=A0A267MKF1_9FIRM|nr:MarR family winged helix-turn-helix transcriptional regulator [Anaeromicrobium sediminis]PAB60059.1 hypothetical protein CCE28_06695 [Anaeromicrobium sediminis]
MNEQLINKLISNIVHFYPLFQKEFLDLRIDNNVKEISPLLFRILDEIHIEGNTTVSTLSKRLSISMPNTSRSVNTLIKLGYVDKRQDEVDKRIIHLYLTMKGLDLVENSILEAEKKIFTKFNVLDEKEIKELSDSFYLIRNLLIKARDLNENSKGGL